MTKLLWIGSLACTIALAAHPTLEAGKHEIRRVYIAPSPTFAWADGNAGDAYNSAGDVEYIWCRANVYPDGNYIGACYARDTKKQELMCLTTEPHLVQFMLGINGDSTIYFEARDGWDCGKLAVTNGSLAAPKLQITPDSDPSAVDVTGELDEVKP